MRRREYADMAAAAIDRLALYASRVEPVTHMLTGACLSRALGFPRRARFATLACVIAAELPDADYVYRLGGPVTYFQHHRGWTHAFWSLPLQAAFVVALMYGWRFARRRWKRRRSHDDPPPFRPVLLGCMALLAQLSHILLDWTNNYGVRPFAPWNPRWYAGELVFIVEPVLLLVLGGALLLPFIFSVTDAEIGIRRTRYSGQWIAAIALVVMVALWGWRWQQHDTAIHIAEQQEYAGGRVLRVSANPYPVNGYRWHMVVETPNNFQTGAVDTRNLVMEMDQQPTPKPATTLSTLAAKHSLLGRAYLDWSRFPVTTDMGTVGENHPEMDLQPQERAFHDVLFQDLRFGYDIWNLHGQASRALSGEAWVNDQREVERMYLGSSEQNP
ncbi:metal-dependent hydrolase [Terriglobus aquaticus]|uniref:Metal-dependent hydrolase n=1 Tax=Terriglobus aquaticus TaxID=940139 RepID=A0ABW9KQ80_9BACT|nr:metal-dependent hydrolase [Terriglobus aquaticus]